MGKLGLLFAYALFIPSLAARPQAGTATSRGGKGRPHRKTRKDIVAEIAQVSESAAKELNVHVAAIQFCAALTREVFGTAKMKRGWWQAKAEEVRKRLGKVEKAENFCQKVLTNTLDPDLKLMMKQQQLGTESEGNKKSFGRLKKVTVGIGWQHKLGEVCKDECRALIDQLSTFSYQVFSDLGHGRGFEDSCAERIVKKVEADILGCCSRACGWNQNQCTYWPFFGAENRGSWEAECCTEYNILEGSERDRMCNSTLSKAQLEQVEEDPQPSNTKEQKLVGQTSLLQIDDQCHYPFTLFGGVTKAMSQWRKTPFRKNRKHFTLDCKHQRDHPDECDAFMMIQEVVTCCDTSDSKFWRGLWTEAVEISSGTESNDMMVYLHEGLSLPDFWSRVKNGFRDVAEAGLRHLGEHIQVPMPHDQNFMIKFAKER